MKKLLLLFIGLTLMSCSGDDSTSPVNNQQNQTQLGETEIRVISSIDLRMMNVLVGYANTTGGGVGLNPNPMNYAVHVHTFTFDLEDIHMYANRDENSQFVLRVRHIDQGDVTPTGTIICEGLKIGGKHEFEFDDETVNINIPLAN